MPIFSVPYARDEGFIDRSEIFAQIEEQLEISHRASIYGIGGIGWALFKYIQAGID